MRTARALHASFFFWQVMDLHRISLGDQGLANVAAAFPRLVHVDLSFCKVSIYPRGQIGVCPS